MTLTSVSKVYGMHKKSRIEVGCGTVTVRTNESKICEMQKRAEKSSDVK